MRPAPAVNSCGAQHFTRPQLRTPPGPWTDDTQRRAGRIRTAGDAAARLGTGHRVTAQDTVPFTIWVAQRFLRDFRAAAEACRTAGGDVDTTAAIVGGIVAAYDPAVPAEWKAAREPLP